MEVKNKRRIKNAFNILKAKIGLFSFIVLASIIWGYLNKELISVNSAIIGGLISYIITDIGLSVALEFLNTNDEENKKSINNVSEIRYNRNTNPLNKVDIESIDKDYTEKFLNNVKKNDTGGNTNTIVDISNIINNEDTDEEIYKNLGIKL